MPKIDAFNKYFDEYDAWFDLNPHIYKTELCALEKLLPKGKKGLEIGVGTGRFAVPLGIKIGLEPSDKMAKYAQEAGIEVVKGVAEKLPFSDKEFDFVLMVTVLCFLDDVSKAFLEVRRVLNDNGSFIISFIDRETEIGRIYQKEKDNDKFFRKAVFYSAEEVIELIKTAGFRIEKITQTVFDPASKNVEKTIEGYGKGVFVSLKATLDGSI